MSKHFSEPYDPCGGNVKFELDLSNYSTKADFKKAIGVHTSNLTAKCDLTSLKAEIYKIDVDKLNTAPVDLSKLSNLVNTEIVEKIYMIS